MGVTKELRSMVRDVCQCGGQCVCLFGEMRPDKININELREKFLDGGDVEMHTHHRRMCGQWHHQLLGIRKLQHRKMLWCENVKEEVVTKTIQLPNRIREIDDIAIFRQVFCIRDVGIDQNANRFRRGGPGRWGIKESIQCVLL